MNHTINQKNKNTKIISYGRVLDYARWVLPRVSERCRDPKMTERSWLNNCIIAMSFIDVRHTSWHHDIIWRMNKCRRIGTLITKFLRKEIGCVTMKRQTITRTSSDAQPGKKRHWREGLLETMEEPESIVRKDDKIVVVKDKYPKARHHFLILPREPINSLKDITEQHKQLLKHMEKIASEVADEQKGYEFLIGYHAVPTMSRLHLHVISTDFDSPCLKTKHHWNSFTTPFLRHPKGKLKRKK